MELPHRPTTYVCAYTAGFEFARLTRDIHAHAVSEMRVYIRTMANHLDGWVAIPRFREADIRIET